MRLTEFFLKKPLNANLIMVLILLVGGLTLFQLKRATYPTVQFDILKISTTYPGASAEDVEINVTKKLEDELKGVNGIEKIKSNSLENLSLIYVFVDTDADDIQETKDDIRRAVDRVNDLPETITEKPVVEEMRSANVPVIEIAVVGRADEIVRRKVARDLEEEIREIKGVMSVEKVGYRKREVKILIDNLKLSEEYISFNEVIHAIKSRNVRSSGGSLESYLAEKKIVTFSEFQTLPEVKNVIVRGNFSGDNITLHDIATVTDSFEDYQILPRTNGQTSINLLIRSHGNGDIIDISEAIHQLIEEFEETIPQNVSIVLVSDYSRYTSNVLGIVKSNAIIGFILVLLVLILFLDRYSALWVAAGIPISLLGAIALFPLFDIDINFISLTTMIIVVGIVVDDAIVIGENISRHREMGKAPYEAALQGVKELVWPVTITVISTILAFIPMYFMLGVTGKFVRQIPTIVILALVISLLEAITILPAHLKSSPARQASASQLMTRFQNWYQNFLLRILKHPVKTTLGVFALPIAAILLFSLAMKFILFPYTDIDMFYVIAELDEGTGITATAEKMKSVEELIAHIPKHELVNFTTSVGHHDMDVYGGSAGLHENWALITIFLKPAAERDRPSEMIMAEISEKLRNITGFKKLYLEKYYDGPPIGKPVTITLVSDDDKLLQRTSQKIYQFIKTIPGILSPDIDRKAGKQEMRLKLDYHEMARAGITVAEVAHTIRAAYDGIVASSLVREGEEIDFRVQLKPEQRQKIAVLLELQIPNAMGKLVSLKKLATLIPQEGIESIRHYNGQRSITVTADVDTDIMTAVQANQQVRAQFEKEINALPGLRMIFGGEEQATQESMQSFLWAFICALVAIYFLLTALLGSFVQPFIIMAAIPIGIAGVIFGFFFHQLPIGFLALIGSLGLIGVIVNDSLVMITYLNELRGDKANLSLQEIIHGSKTRLRPVILTTITTVAGLIPTIYGFGGYEPFIVPIVLALASGLILATIGTLVLVPTLYTLSYGRTD